MSENRVVIVTGAATGIGKGITQSFLDAGYSVFAVDKTPMISQENLHYHQADLSDLSQILPIVNKCVETFGHIDVLINNAGVSLGQDFLTTDLATWTTTIAVNQTAPFFLGQAAASHMVKEKIKGRIINIGSVNSISAEFGHSSYVTSKGAITMMTKSMAVDLGAYGIYVNAIAPGIIRTEKTAEGLKTPARLNAIENGIPVKRAGEVQEIGELALFLANPKTTYITGQLIVIDGGYLSYCRAD
jgi:NAD(P)-dependent dehydrogenase (short-subunit alcohol dehydrogenase family)